MSIFTGYLNGRAVEMITQHLIEKAIIYLLIYFLIEIIIEGLIGTFADSILLKIESKLTRKLGYETYKKDVVFKDKKLEDVKGVIEFREVSFSYPNEKKLKRF